MQRKTWSTVVVGALLAFNVSAADTFPTRAVTLVVGFPPGGSTDLIARMLAQGMAERLGQAVVVENKPGATGAIASMNIAAAKPDGYRLLMTAAGPHGTMPAVSAKMQYDAVKDFTPIAAVAGGPNVLMVNLGLKANNLQELIAIAKQRPGTLNIGSTSLGSTPQMSGELIKKMANVDIVHIPFQGGGPLMTALLGGQIQTAIDNLPSALPQIRAGKQFSHSWPAER